MCCNVLLTNLIGALAPRGSSSNDLLYNISFKSFTDRLSKGFNSSKYCWKKEKERAVRDHGFWKLKITIRIMRAIAIWMPGLHLDTQTIENHTVRHPIVLARN